MKTLFIRLATENGKVWRGEPVDQATSGLSAREWEDFMGVVGTSG